MAWLNIILMILQYGPSVFKIIKEIIELIDDIKNQEVNLLSSDGVPLESQLSEAIHFYKLTGSKSGLRRLRDELRARRKTIDG